MKPQMLMSPCYESAYLRVRILNCSIVQALPRYRYRWSGQPAGSKFYVLKLILLVSLLCTVLPASSEDSRGEARERIELEGFLYGIGLAVDREIYKDYDRRVILLPVIGYRGEKLTVFGPFVRYELLKSGAVEFSIQASPRFDGFDESDSDIFEGMDERKFSMDLGFGIEYARDDWKFELSSLHDVLGRSNGTELSTGLSKVFRSGSLFIEPGIGFSYLDSRHVDYYYGVSTNEVASFRPRFEGDDAVNTNLGITVTTPALFNGLTRFGFEHTWYDPDISDSPLTDEDTSLSFFFAYSRFF